MRILVFNAGSSSLKFGVFDTPPGAALGQVSQRLKGSFDRFSADGCDLVTTIAAPRRGRAPHRSIGEAIAALPALLAANGIAANTGALDAIAHRIAHGGTEFTGPALLTRHALAQIERLTPLAPLHNPANLEGVRVATECWPGVPQWGVFDTAFHLSQPARATTYAVPKAWRDAGMRRYGFHGTSHKYVARRAAEALGAELRDLRMVSLHLGNGASACAINRGVSIDTSMGLTPLEGLVMGTRPGDLDPGVVGFVHRTLGLDIAGIEAALNADSGLKGLTGTQDMRDVETRAANGDPQAQLAIDVYAYRARKYIGAYAAAMGGLDVLVFTGGIGENSASMRRRICDGLEFIGLKLDHDRNLAVTLDGRAAPQIQAYGARVQVLVTETAEQLMIAHEVACARADSLSAPPPPIPVAVSARHVHLDAAAVEALFGRGYALHPAKHLRQPGHWAAAERVTLEGPKGRIERVAILGPLRARTQIELSRTDSFALGIDTPLRQSGDLDGTPQLRLIGPAGSLDTDGLIIAARHIHMNPDDASRMGLADGDSVDVSLSHAARALTLANVLVRVQQGAFSEMHIDTDEANAAGIGTIGEGDLLPHTIVTALAPREPD